MMPCYGIGGDLPPDGVDEGRGDVGAADVGSDYDWVIFSCHTFGF